MSYTPVKPKGVILQMNKNNQEIQEAFRHEKQEKSREKCTIWMPTKAESKIQYKSTEFGMNVNTLTQPLFQPPLTS